MPNFSIPQSALTSLGVVMQTVAHNIANVNTDGFRPSHAVLMSGPYQDEGVQVGALYRSMEPGPAVINHLGQNDVRDSNDIAAMGMRNSQENYDTAVAQDVDRTQQANAADALAIHNYREGQYARNLIQGTLAPSNTDLPREFATMIVSEHAYSANAAVIRAWDELTGSLLNVKV
jgi:flagellar basal-body rod protein FlgC